MSLLGTIGAGVGILGSVAGLFGGGSKGSTAGGVIDPTGIASKFSARCGIFPPITKAQARVARQSGPGGECAAGRQLATNMGISSIPRPFTPQPIPIGLPPGMGMGSNILAAVTGSGSAQAGFGAAGFRAAGAVLSPALRRKAIAFAKNFGIQLAATVFGISLLEMAEIVAKPPRRRRRGISAAQLANARRVNCKIQSMAKSLGMSCSGRRAPTRRKTCR